MLNATVFHIPTNNDDAMLVLNVRNNYGGLEIAPTVIISDSDTSGAANWKDQCRVIKTHGMTPDRALALRWNILRQMIGTPPWGDNVTGNIEVPGNPLKNLWAAADWKARKSFAARRLEKRLLAAKRLFPVPNEAFAWLIDNAKYAEDAYLRAIALGVKLGTAKPTQLEKEHRYFTSDPELRRQWPAFPGDSFSIFAEDRLPAQPSPELLAEQRQRDEKYRAEAKRKFDATQDYIKRTGEIQRSLPPGPRVALLDSRGNVHMIDRYQAPRFILNGVYRLPPRL